MEFEDDINYEDIRPFTERNINNLEWIEKDDEEVSEYGIMENDDLTEEDVTVSNPTNEENKINQNSIIKLKYEDSVTGSNPKTNVEINNSKINKIIHNIETNRNNESCWTYDTGASEHITNNKNILDNFKKINNYDVPK
jgi:hypothetical protein